MSSTPLHGKKRFKQASITSITIKSTLENETLLKSKTLLKSLNCELFKSTATTTGS